MGIRYKLTVTREWGETKWGKEGEQSGEGTYIKDPYTWTTTWGLTMELGRGWTGQERATGEKLGQL